jgi:hypothetical protein
MVAIRRAKLLNVGSISRPMTWNRRPFDREARHVLWSTGSDRVPRLEPHLRRYPDLLNPAFIHNGARLQGRGETPTRRGRRKPIVDDRFLLQQHADVLFRMDDAERLVGVSA